MNASNLFRSLMSKATQLTRSGNLQEATAVIQHALGRAFSRTAEPPQAPPPAGPNPAARPHAAPAPGGPDIIDSVAREIPEPGEASPRMQEMREEDTFVPPAPPTAPYTGDGVGGQFISGHHAEAAGERHYKLFVPPNPQGRALPLVVMLHGCKQNPDDFASGTQMNEVALSQGFFVLYPAQTTHANTSGCWNWFKHNHQRRDRGEPAVLAGMTRAVMRQYGIDPRRVYVAGLSAGGAMAAILGDAYPDLFAAVGVHSGLATGAATDVTSAFAAMSGGTSPLSGIRSPAFTMPGQAPEPAARLGQAPPTIVFHGDDDKTVHPINGEHVVAACLSAGRAGSPAVHPERGRSDNGREYTRHCHRDDEGRVVSEHWIVHGAGHAWSGGSARGSYTDPRGPDASVEMIRFFLANPARQPQ